MGTPQFCDFSKVGLGRTFGIAYMRNHILKVRPIYIIYNNYSNIIKIEIVEILGFEFIPKFIVTI